MRVAVIVLFEVLIVSAALWSVRTPVPTQIGAYVSYCKLKPSACEHEIALVNAALTAEYLPGLQYCPPSREDWVTVQNDFERWLVVHPHRTNGLVTVAIREALLERNACHKE